MRGIAIASKNISIGAKVGPSGAQGITGLEGNPGLPGQQGNPGINGTSSQWLQGTVTPANNLGIVGDWYINTVTSDVYEKTGITVWTFRANLKGSIWIRGTANPTTGEGRVGDWFVNTTNWNVFEKTATATWTNRGTIQGAAGTNGTPGTNGTDGVGVLNNTTAEQSTNRTWTDGRTIYQRTFALTQTATGYTGNHGIANFRELVDAVAVLLTAWGANTFARLPYLDATGCVGFGITTTQIMIWITYAAGMNLTGKTVNLTLYYTKNP